jgi:hypothetical protein
MACEGKLLKIFGCVVPSDKPLQMQVLDSSNPDGIGKVVNAGLCYSVFLVNEGKHEIANVEMYTGEFDGGSKTR